MKQLKILLLTVIVFVFCMCLPACFLFDSQNTANTSSNSSSGNNSNSSGSSNGNNNNSKPQTDTDGTFIFSGSSIKAASTSISGDIVIPSEHNGNKIDTIPKEAFKGCTAITSVVVPNSVTSIGDGAFSGCSLIKKITLPFIGKQKGNSNDTDAYFGYIFGDSKYQGSTSVTVYGAWVSWYIPSLLREVTITNETVIAQGAFYKCSMLNKITINSEAKDNVGKDAFTGTVTPTWAPRSPQQMI